jgi:hypothetical protein
MAMAQLHLRMAAPMGMHRHPSLLKFCLVEQAWKLILFVDLVDPYQLDNGSVAHRYSLECLETPYSLPI